MPCARDSCRRRSRPFARGFSLIELSVVIVIVSIVAVMGLELTATFFNRTAYQVTQERLAQIDQALVRYERQYGRLPCPANQAYARSNTCYGKEYRINGGNNCDIYTTACSAGTWGGLYSRGDVPARDLDLPLSVMLDGYGNKISYAVVTGLLASGTYSANADSFTIRSGKQDTTCGSGGNRCQTRGTAAYVLVSHGKDSRGATTKQGAVSVACLPAPAASYDEMIDTVNCRFGAATALAYVIPSNVFYDSRYNIGTVESTHFDDVIKWRSKSNM